MDKFKKLGIIEPILNVIKDFGFEEPTEVQEKSIPSVIEGKDIIAGASTGSGKTLVFASGIIQNSERYGVIQALVLVPTRELAEQVTKELKKFSRDKRMNITEVYGGVAIHNQIRKLERADIVVGTPGRILDHIGRQTIELGYVKTLVLDEADRMLDMGFIRDVRKIIEKCPRNRQTMLFSATLSHDIIKLSKDYMNNPIKVDCKSDVDPLKLTQIYYDVPDPMKFSTLVHFIKNDKSGLVMVFCNTQRNTDFVAENLQAFGIKALAIHGGHTQDKRRKTMEQFHSKNIDVLVCTDVAARGLDIKGVSHIYNYDLPKESEQYIHRIGRTARAGKEGKAISILASRDYDNFRRLDKDYPDLPIQKKELPEIERLFLKFKADKFRRSGHRGAFSGPRSRDSGRSRNSFSRPRASSASGGYRMDRGDDRERHSRPRYSGNRDSSKSGGDNRRPRREDSRGGRRDNRRNDRRPGRPFRSGGSSRFSRSKSRFPKQRRY